MSTLTLANLSHVVETNILEGGGTVDGRTVERFETAMARHAGSPPLEVAADAVPPVGAKPEATAAVNRGMTDDPTDPMVTGALPARGDMILDGFKVLRGEFDARQTRVSDLMAANTTSARDLLALQMEVANFSLMVELTSKLVGKSTQTFDTLMKGQ